MKSKTKYNPGLTGGVSVNVKNRYIGLFAVGCRVNVPLSDNFYPVTYRNEITRPDLSTEVTTATLESRSIGVQFRFTYYFLHLTKKLKVVHTFERKQSADAASESGMKEAPSEK